MIRRIQFALFAAALLCVAAVFAAQDFTFTLIGDRTGGYGGGGVYGAIIAELEGHKPAFVLSVGDQIEGYSGDAAALNQQWDDYWAEAKFTTPFYITPGNHDIYNDTMLGVWRARTWREPCYSFDYEGVHVAALDTGRWEKTDEWLEKSGYREWLEKDLAAHRDDRLTVVVFHKPYWYETLADGKPDALHEIFKKYGVDAVFNGHFHVNATAIYDGITYTIVGTSGGGIDAEDPSRGAFFQYMVCDVTGDKLTTALYMKGEAAPLAQIPVADQKFLDKVEVEFIQLPALAVAEGPTAEPTEFVLDVFNATPAPFKTAAAWTAGDNWAVTPANVDLEIQPGAHGRATFAAQIKGPFYPLPEVTLDYPYGEGKTHHYKGFLPARRTQRCRRLDAPPTINGDLGDSCWSAAAKANYFCCPEGKPVTIEPTTFYFGYDDQNLYVAARCEHEDAATMVTNAKDRDDAAVSRDDMVGLFILPDVGVNAFYQVYLSAAGTVYDIKYTFAVPMELNTDGAPAWNADLKAATAQRGGFWTAEMAIPFAALGAQPPQAGDEWRLNFRRKQIAAKSSADWQYPIGFEPAKFGFLVFE